MPIFSHFFLWQNILLAKYWLFFTIWKKDSPVFVKNKKEKKNEINLDILKLLKSFIFIALRIVQWTYIPMHHSFSCVILWDAVVWSSSSVHAQFVIPFQTKCRALQLGPYKYTDIVFRYNMNLKLSFQRVWLGGRQEYRHGNGAGQWVCHAGKCQQLVLFL